MLLTLHDSSTVEYPGAKRLPLGPSFQGNIQIMQHETKSKTLMGNPDWEFNQSGNMGDIRKENGADPAKMRGTNHTMTPITQPASHR